jgi:hypothetical protein
MGEEEAETVKRPSGGWRQGAPWWAMPLVVPGVILGAIGLAFSMFLQVSIVTFQSVLLVVISVIFLAIGEYGWAIASLAFVALLTALRVYGSRE